MAETVLVTVNGKSLTSSMAQAMGRQIAARQGVPPQMVDDFLAQAGAQLEEQAVTQFVSQTLVEAEAAKSEIQIAPEEIDAVVARLTETLPEGTTIEQALAAQGMSLEQLREDVKKNEQIRMLYEARTVLETPVTDEQAKAFYDSNPDSFATKESADASHILTACDEAADAEAQTKAKAEADAIKKQLDEGASFAELAKEKSTCSSAANGGSLGTFERGSMVPEFEEAAFSQPIDEIGPVVKTKFGYHIILVTGRKEAGTRTLEEASNEIRQHLENQAKAELFNAYIETLKKNAEITYGEAAQPATL